jgi:hypothetical protein
MLKRTGWIFVFLILLGLFGLAATIDVGSALPFTQSDHGAALGAVPGNLVLLAKTKCPYDFCYGCEKEKVCLVWKHNDQCTDHATSDLSCFKWWVWKKKCSCKASYCPNGGCICKGGDPSSNNRDSCEKSDGTWLC